jgi:hypothetical protein
MQNIILHSSDKIELEIFKEIEKNKKCRVHIVLYWDNSDLLRIKKIFPNVKTINYSELIWKGLEGDFEDINQNYFSPEIKEKLHEFEDIFYYMIDRFDRAKNITFYQRYNLYKFLVCFWIDNIKKYNINFFYSRSVPHEAADYILFLLIKIFRHKALFFMYAFNGTYFFPVNDYRGPWRLLETNIKKQNKKNLKTIQDSYIVEYIKQIKSNYSRTYGKNEDLFMMENFKDNFLFNKIMKIIHIIKIISKLNLFNVKNKYYYIKTLQRYFSLILVQKTYNTLENDQKIKFNYNKTLPKKYIYFLLPYQPESTLVPQGGKFYDVFMALSLISKNIPKDWNILVKEHPAQFIRTNNRYGYNGRDINFYNRLEKIQKVILFNNKKYDHFYTIDHSQAVATINGTSGFESIIRKKPCIIFGEVFYATAPNVYKIKNSYDAKYLDKIINKIKIFNEQKIINFINGVIDSGEQIFFDELHAKIHNQIFNYEQNKSKLKRLIFKYIK